VKAQMVKNTFILVLFSFASKILGFGREVTQASLFGATNNTDALILAFLFLQYITGGISAIIEKVIIPKVAIYKEYNGELNEKVNRFFFFMFLVLIIVSSMLLISIKYILFFMKVQNPEVVTKMIYFIIPIAIIMSINSLLQAVLKAFNQFKVVGVVMLVQNSIIIITILLLHNLYGIYSVLIGWLIANAINYVHILFETKKIGFYWSTSFLFTQKSISSEIKRFISYNRIIAPVLGLVLVSYVNSFLEKKITFGLGEGATTMIYYGTIINDLVYSIFIISAMSVLIPALSKSDNKQLMTQNMIRIIIMCFLPITVIILCYAHEAVEFLLYFGDFSINNVRSISNIFIGFSLGLMCLGIRETLYTRAYSSGNTKLPFKANLVASSVNIFFNFILSLKFGIIGVAAGTTISIYASMFYMGYHIKEKYVDLEFIKKISIGVMGTISVNLIYITIFRNPKNIFAIAGIALFSLVVYIIILYLLQTKEVVKLINGIKERAK